MSKYVMIPVEKPIKDFIESLGSKKDTYQSILIREVKGLKQHLVEIGFLKEDDDESPDNLGVTVSDRSKTKAMESAT